MMGSHQANDGSPQNTQQKTLPEPMAVKMWQKGQSGNPGGRPKMPDDVKEALEGGSLRAAQRLVQLVDSPDERIALMASETVLSRLYGKPTQQVDSNITTTSVQQAHLQVLVELQQKREAAMKTIEARVEEGHTDKVTEYDPSKPND
jgi:hypothetical protein